MYNPYSLAGKNILVSGASSGIGRTTAIECAKLGASVIVTARNEERLSAVFAELAIDSGQHHKMIISDLNTVDGINTLIEHLTEIDGLSSNVGISLGSIPIKFISDEAVEKVWQVNTFSQVKLIRGLIKKKKLKKNSSIVFTSSVGGVTAFNVGNSVYGMSKAALDSFMKFCAVDFASRGIRCNSVCPGMIETPMNGGEGALNDEDYKKDMEHYLLKRYGRPEEVAWSITFLLSDASSFITGVSLSVDGGLSIIR